MLPRRHGPEDLRVRGMDLFGEPGHRHGHASPLTPRRCASGCMSALDPRRVQRGLGVQMVGDHVGQRLEPSLSELGETRIRRCHEGPSCSRGHLDQERTAETRRSRTIPCHDVPATEPTRHPSSAKNASPPDRCTTPWWISYPIDRSCRRRASGAGGPGPSRRSNLVSTGRSPRPRTVPRPLSNRSSIETPSIWYPPQIPRTGRPAAASVLRGLDPCPRRRSHARSSTVARVPGMTTRSASAISWGRAANRTSTPGSATRGSMSVRLLDRGSLDDRPLARCRRRSVRPGPGRRTDPGRSSASTQRPRA